MRQPAQGAGRRGQVAASCTTAKTALLSPIFQDQPGVGTNSRVGGGIDPRCALRRPLPVRSRPRRRMAP